MPNNDDGSIFYALRSRKFWFAYAVPVLLTIASAVLRIITPDAALAAITALSASYGATVAWEDNQKRAAQATVEVAHVQAAADDARLDSTNASTGTR